MGKRHTEGGERGQRETHISLDFKSKLKSELALVLHVNSVVQCLLFQAWLALLATVYLALPTLRTMGFLCEVMGLAGGDEQKAGLEWGLRYCPNSPWSVPGHQTVSASCRAR